MKESRISDENLLRWLENDLTPEEMASFQHIPHGAQYKQILDSVDNIHIPEINLSDNFTRIENKISVKEKSFQIKRRNILISAALLICALIIGYSLWPRKLIITAKVGQPMAHLLPDGSEVKLNSKTKLSYDAEAFKTQRELELHGEAFFEVKQGKSFTVKTPQGFVQVLGTSFNVLSDSDLLMVSCKTGSVKVYLKNIEEVLKPGERIRIEKGKITLLDKIKLESISSWASGESVFESMPLKDVIKALENQFDLKIFIEKSLSEDIFTGSFIHSDQISAMEMVFLPMGLKFEFTGIDKLIVTK